MAARLRTRGELPPVYGIGSDFFTLEVHHGGFFVGHGSTRSYSNGKVDWFDECEADTWSPLWLDDFIGQLGYEKGGSSKIYWLLPGKSLSDGLRFILSDADTNAMISVADKVKNLVIYLDHEDHITGFQLDDIVACPVEKTKKRSAEDGKDKEGTYDETGAEEESEDTGFLDSD
ncbi:unnamed protein product [Urochloa humidicola]